MFTITFPVHYTPGNFTFIAVRVYLLLAYKLFSKLLRKDIIKADRGHMYFANYTFLAKCTIAAEKCTISLLDKI